MLLMTVSLVFTGLFLYDDGDSGDCNTDTGSGSDSCDDKQFLSVVIVIVYFMFCVFYTAVIITTALQARMRALRRCMPFLKKFWDFLDGDDEDGNQNVAGQNVSESRNVAYSAEVEVELPSSFPSPMRKGKENVNM